MKTVLIVNAEEWLERELKTELPDQSYEILCARNVHDVAARFSMSSVDLLLLDMDARTTEDWAELYQLNPAPRVIGLTERSDLGPEIFFGPHMIGLAEKPIHVKNLVNIIEEVLTQQPVLTGLRYILARTADFNEKASYRRADSRPAANRRWGINE